MRGRSLSEVGLGKSRAARQLGAEHALFAARFFTGATAGGSEFQGRDKTESGFLCLLGLGLRRVTSLEFHYGPLEWKRSF